MKKLGILTFHHANNFGAVLQTYALQQVIREEMKYDCDVIDYRNPRFEAYFHNKSLKRKMIMLGMHVLYPRHFGKIKKKNRKFNEFRNRYLITSKQYADCHAFSCAYDGIVVGSDQVWNLNLTEGDRNYFLPYQTGAKKLSYGASFGSGSVSEDVRRQIKEDLSSFESLLIREKDGVEILKGLGDDRGKKVSDPTLLLSGETWKKLAKRHPVAMEKYILLYLVAPPTHAVRLARSMAEKNGWKVYLLDPGRKQIEGVEGIKDVGPDEFVWFILNAQRVITTSFHGLIFSLNLNRPVLFEMNRNRQNTNSRISEIRETYSLEPYEILSDRPEDYEALSYDWDEINRKIEENRQSSKALLKESLNG